jgi:hypothetical protein
MEIMEQFKKWSLGYSGCDGGDIGSPNSKSRWVCGIEWGGGHTPDELLKSMQKNMTQIPKGYDVWEENISYIFNWQIMKLFVAIEGGKVSDYKLFAKDVKPFVEGSLGFFKMNLYPIAFKNTDPAKWINEFSSVTGFSSKEEYIKWCKTNRFQEIRNWTSTFSPEIVICLGKTYIEDFSVAFSDSEATFTNEIIDDREIRWCRNIQGTLVVVLPFMVNRNGLVKNITIQKVGERISQLMQLTNTG